MGTRYREGDVRNAQSARRSDHRRSQPIVATLVNRGRESYLRRILRDHVLVPGRLAADLTAAARMNTLAFVITEPWDAAGVPLAPTIARIKAGYPSVPVVVYCEPTPAAHRETVLLARAGIDAILLYGIDDGPIALHAALDDARGGAIRTEVMQAVRALVRPDGEMFIEYCLAHAHQSLSVQRAALMLGIDRKTLFNRLTHQGLPPPSEIRAWCRALVAARLLEDPGRSEERVGLAIGCGSGTALRRLFLRVVGLRPSGVRVQGGMRYVLDRFTERIRGGRIEHGNRSLWPP